MKQESPRFSGGECQCNEAITDITRATYEWPEGESESGADIVVMWTVYLAANDARDYFQRRRAEDQRRTREQYAARKSA